MNNILSRIDLNALNAQRKQCITFAKNGNDIVKPFKTLYAVQQVTNCADHDGVFFEYDHKDDIFYFYADLGVICTKIGSLCTYNTISDFCERYAKCEKLTAERYLENLEKAEKQDLYINNLDIEVCRILGKNELADHYAVYRMECLRKREEKRAAAERERAAREEKAAAEREENERNAITNAILTLKNGGDLVNCEFKNTTIVLFLLKMFDIKVPIKTQGWINNALAKIYFHNGKISYCYYNSSRNSTVFQKYLDQLYSCVCSCSTDLKDDLGLNDPVNKLDLVLDFSQKLSTETAKPHKKISVEEWEKMLELKIAFEKSERSEKIKRVATDIKTAFEKHGTFELTDGSICLELLDIDDYGEKLEDPEEWLINTDNGYVWLSAFVDCFPDYWTGNTKPLEIAVTSANLSDDLDGQLNFDSCGGSAAKPATPATVPPCPIDEDAAKRGKESYSFSSYVPGSATAAYTAQVARVAAAADKIKPQLTAEDSAKLDRLVNRYAAKLADWTNRKNRCDASYPSWMISGPANYNMRKHEKQMSRLDKLFAEYAEIEQLESKILNYAAVDHPIMSGDENALDKLREKVAELTACREKMKQENAAARKQGKDLPHPSWKLSNSLQNLNRYKERLAALEKAKASETSERITADGVKIVRNTDLMRLQLIFDGKPSDEVRAVLKKNAFKWSPKNSAWQRQLTPNAERSLEAVLKAIN